jgi:uroporphyrinogen decarboxylase
MNKRDLLLNLLQPDKPIAYTPAAFFLHFDPQYHQGQPAVEKHLEFFHTTGMDFLKIQYEHQVTPWPAIKRPSDWARLPHYDEAAFAEPLEVVEGLVKAAKAEALILVTLYSPLMWAAQMAGDERLLAHARHEPALFHKGMEAITETIRTFVRACIRLGVDGFYTSTQGGETHRFNDLRDFQTFVKPYDLSLMREINDTCPFNILHICDYSGSYTDLTRFLDYPGHIVNTPLHAGGQPLSPQAVAAMFNRPYMGGLDRLTTLHDGRPDEIQAAAQSVLTATPQPFILAADCTVPADTPWENLRLAIETAHQHHP